MSAIVKSCACGRGYVLVEWEGLALRGWSGDLGANGVLELRDCAECSSTLAIRTTRGELERIVDGLGARVTYQQLDAGGWKARVTGIAIPPHLGHGATAAAALAEVMTFALRIGALK